MVDTVKISDLNIVSTIADEDLFVVVDQTGPYSNSITRANLVSSLASEFVRGDNTDNGTVNIRSNDADFIISDATDPTTNYFWRKHDSSELRIGTADAVITPRSDIIPDINDTRDLGNSTRYFARAYIDNGYFSNSAGIGTSTPEKLLHVKAGDSGATPTNIYAALIENSSTTGLQILVPDGDDAHLALGNPSDPQLFRLTMTKGVGTHISSEGNITFGTTSAGGNQFIQNRLRIDEEGNVSIGLAYTDQKLEVNGTVKATAFAGNFSGDVGVGTASPSYRLDVVDTTSGIVARFKNGDSGGTPSSTHGDLVIESDGNLGLQLLGTNTSDQRIGFGDPESAFSGAITYNHSGNYMAFRGNDSERMRISSSGDVGVGTESPSYRLDVVDNVSGIVARVRNGDSGGTPSTTHGEFVVESDGANMGIQLLGTNTSDQRILFGDSDAAAPGAVIYNHTGDYMSFRGNNAERARIDSSGNFLLGGTATPTSADSALAIFNGTAPAASVTNGVVLYAEDVSASSELKVRDEAGNITTLSPHNFELIPEGPSEDLAWSYYSERDGKRINVDMLKAIRVLEQLSGTKLVYEG